MYTIQKTNLKLNKLKNFILTFSLLLFVLLYSCKSDIKVPRTIISEEPLIEYSRMNGSVRFYHSKFDKFTDTLNQLNNLAMDLALEHDYKEARKHFLRALKINPNNVVLLNNIGNLEKNDKNYIKAIRYYKESFTKSDSLYFIAAMNLGQTYSKIGSNRTAEKTLRYVIKNTDIDFVKGITFYYLADNYLKYGNVDKGKNALTKAGLLLKGYKGFDKELNELSEKLESYYD